MVAVEAPKHGGMRDLDGGLGSSYEESSNSSPFDMPSDIMSKQFSLLGRSPAQQPAPQYKAPASQGGLIMMVGSRQVMIPDLDDEEDCSKDLNQYISQIDELMGNYL